MLPCSRGPSISANGVASWSSADSASAAGAAVLAAVAPTLTAPTPRPRPAARRARRRPPRRAARPPRQPPARAPSSARRPLRGGSSSPRFSWTRASIFTASNEWPPRSKKSSSTPDTVDAQHLAPDRRKRLLDGRLGRHVGVLQLGAEPVGRRQRAPVELAVRGGRETPPAARTSTAPCMARAGSCTAAAAPQRPPIARRLAPRRRRAAGRRGASSRTTAAAPPTSGCAARTASISSSSIRKPRSLTCRSTRPRNSSVPSSRQRTRSPVRYSRAPGSPENGFGDELLGRQLRSIEVAAARARRRRCRARRALRSGAAAAGRRGRRTSCSRAARRSAAIPRPARARGPTTRPSSPSARTRSTATRNASAAPRPARAAAPRRRPRSSGSGRPSTRRRRAAASVVAVAAMNVAPARAIQSASSTPSIVASRRDEHQPGADHQRQVEVGHGKVDGVRGDARRSRHRVSSQAISRM